MTTIYFSGLYEITCGSIKVLGVDHSEHVHEIQRVVGWCPQGGTILFKNLTVKEHIFFFARVRTQKLKDIFLKF